MGNKCEIHFCEKKSPKIKYLNWMSYLDNNKELKDLTIPGTHNSCALHGISFSINQSWSLENQLNGGIRFFDLRLRLYNNKLKAYHGPIDQKIYFDEILNIFLTYINNHPKEFILMSIQKEYKDEKTNKSISDLFNDYIINFKDKIINYNRELYNLKIENLRGKIIFFDAFYKRLDMQNGFFIQNEWVVNYSKEIKKKKKYIKTQFNRTITFNNDKNIYINYLSGSSDYLLVSPSSIAYKTNKEVMKYKGRLGIVLCDFPGEGLIYHLIKQNFNYDIFEKIALYNPLDFNNEELGNFILENIKYKTIKSLKENDFIFFGTNINFIHVDTFKYLSLDEKGNLICQKENFNWVIELKEKGEGNINNNYLEDKDKVYIKSHIKNFECNIFKASKYISSINDNNKEIYNSNVVCIKENGSFFYSTYFQFIEGTKNQSVTRGKGQYCETEFIISIN